MADINALQALCAALPPDINRIETEMASGRHSAEDITHCALAYYDLCFCERRDFILRNAREPAYGELHSDFLLPLTSAFLRHGLLINAEIDECNAMHALFYIDHGYRAADALRLMLDHGGKTDLFLSGESFAGDISFSTLYDAPWLASEYPDAFDGRLHYWLVLLGYGSRNADGSSAIQMLGEHSQSILKEHEAFGYRIEETQEDREGWRLIIYEKATNEAVAIV